jgi:hypothetical protein
MADSRPAGGGAYPERDIFHNRGAAAHTSAHIDCAVFGESVPGLDQLTAWHKA